MRSSILCLCLLPVLSWATVASAQDSAAELAIQARSVLRLNCSRCHRGPGSEGGDFDMLNPQDVAKHDLLKPGKPDESAIFRRIIKGEMPPRPAQLFVEDGEAIRAWIAAGAPAFSGEQAARQRVTLEAVLTAVRDQLVKTPKEDRRYLRFFTLQNLYNDSRVLDADMRLYRAALSKAANSLSWKSRIVSPRAIDKAETLFVVDLRELDWDRTKGWNKLLRAYPYALRSDNTRDADLSKLDEEITELSGTILPIVRADWFIATATRPPLYYDILEIPKVAADLETALKVEIATNFLKPVPERIARAGFARSGVSGQN